jgi:hypothetical protein
MKAIGIFWVVGLLFIQANALTGKIVDDCGQGLPACQIWIDGTNSGQVTAADGSFSVSNQDLAVKSFSPVRTIGKSAVREIYTLDGKKIDPNRGFLLSRGVYFIRTAQGVCSRLVVDNRIPIANVWPAVSGLSKKMAAHSVYIECLRHESASLLVANLDTVINAVMRETKTLFISPLQKDKISYFVTGTDSARKCCFYLFKDGAEAYSIFGGDTIRIFESGSYVVKFASKDTVDSQTCYVLPHSCNKGWDTISFSVQQPAIVEGANFVIKDDPLGFGKVVQFQKIISPKGNDTSYASNIFVRQSQKVSVTLRKAFFDSKECDTFVTVNGTMPHPDCEYFHFGNPNGKKVLAVYSYDFTPSYVPGVDSEAYFEDDLLATPQSIFESRDSAGNLDTLPQQKIDPATQDIYVCVAKTTAAFIQGIYDLPISGKVDLLYFSAHGDSDKVVFGCRSGEYLVRSRLLSLSADTVAQLQSKFSPNCLGYFCSCNIADNYAAGKCWADVFSDVFEMSFYGASSEVSSSYYCFFGLYHFITPAMYKPGS